LDLIKDYDLDVYYHPRKASVMADALSTKSYVTEVQATPMPKELCAEFEQLNLSIVTNAMELEVTPNLEQEICMGQLEDEKFKEIAENIVIGMALGFRIDENGTMVWEKDMCT
jgi:hypothetical protein